RSARRPRPARTARASRSGRSARTPTTCAPAARSRAAFPSSSRADAVPFATLDGIRTRYEVIGSGPPLLMYAPGGFDATVEKWSTMGVYARVKLLEHLPKRYSCIAFDRRECGQSGGRVD